MRYLRKHSRRWIGSPQCVLTSRTGENRWLVITATTAMCHAENGKKPMLMIKSHASLNRSWPARLSGETGHGWFKKFMKLIHLLVASARDRCESSPLLKMKLSAKRSWRILGYGRWGANLAQRLMLNPSSQIHTPSPPWMTTWSILTAQPKPAFSIKPVERSAGAFV